MYGWVEAGLAVEGQAKLEELEGLESMLLDTQDKYFGASRDLDAREKEVYALEKELGIYNEWLHDEAERLDARLRPVPNDLVGRVLETCSDFAFEEGQGLIEQTSRMIAHVGVQINNVRNLMLCMEYEGGEWFDHAWSYLNDAVVSTIMAHEWTVEAEGE